MLQILLQRIKLLPLNSYTFEENREILIIGYTRISVLHVHGKSEIQGEELRVSDCSDWVFIGQMDA